MFSVGVAPPANVAAVVTFALASLTTTFDPSGIAVDRWHDRGGDGCG